MNIGWDLVIIVAVKSEMLSLTKLSVFTFADNFQRISKKRGSKVKAEGKIELTMEEVQLVAISQFCNHTKLLMNKMIFATLPPIKIFNLRIKSTIIQLDTSESTLLHYMLCFKGNPNINNNIPSRMHH